MGVTRHPWYSGDAPRGLSSDARALRRMHASLLAALGRGDALMDGFYARLLARAPELGALLPAELDGLKCKVRGALALFTSPIADPGEVEREIERLGRLHAGLGLGREQYELAASALVECLAELGGARWSEELAREWTLALRALGASMAASGRGPH